jgi:thiol-disulfide isomerase/thioredoxin
MFRLIVTAFRRLDKWRPAHIEILAGKLVVIDLWAFDCEPCIEAMPHIVELHEK